MSIQKVSSVHYRYNQFLNNKKFKNISNKHATLIPQVFFFNICHHIGCFFKFKIFNKKKYHYKKKIINSFKKHNFFFKFSNMKYFVFRYLYYRLLQKKNSSKVINLYLKIINFLTRVGKMSVIKSTLSYSFLKLSKNLKMPKTKLFLLMFLRLYTKVEIRHLKVRRRVHTVPFLISFERQFFLALKWLLMSIKENKERCSYDQKFSLEFTNIVKNKSSSITFLVKNNNLAIKNRSNVHYRW